MIQRTIHIPEDDEAHIIERADGFYWLDPETEIEFGPFSTAALAIADMESSDDSYEPEDTLDDVEAELGIADWIDPETGEPSEDSIHLPDD